MYFAKENPSIYHKKPAIIRRMTEFARPRLEIFRPFADFRRN